MGWGNGLVRAARSGSLMLAGLSPLMLAGCGFPPPMTPAEREALANCRSDAERVYAAQNRYQLSERGNNDAPFSGSAPATSPSDGLADQYSNAQTVSDCMKRSDAVPVATPPATP